MKSTGVAPRFLLFSSVWIPLMKHDNRMFEPAFQTSIPVDLLHVCFIDLNMKIKKSGQDH